MLSPLTPNKLISCGVKLQVIYMHDGLAVVQDCILAKTFEEDFLFQVISINGHYSGYIEGYIRKQFDSNSEKVNSCTGDHLVNQLNEYVFPNIQSIKILESTNERIEKL